MGQRRDCSEINIRNSAIRKVIHLFSSPVQYEYEAQDDPSSANMREIEL